MGAGAAVIMPMGLAIIPLLFPEQADRRRAVTVTTIGALIAMPLGPLLGGWILTHFAWGWIFLINAPIVALALLGVRLLVPESRDPANPRLDWPGALLSAAGIVGIVYAIIEEPARGWTGPVLASLLAGVVLTGLFAVRQRTCAEPLIDLRLFRDRLFSWGTAAFAILSFALTGVLFILTPYLQSVQGNDAQGTGARLLPMIAALIAAAAASEVLGARIGVRVVIPAGMTVSAAGLVILAQATASTGYGLVALALAVFGAGLGLGLPLAAEAVLGTLAPHQTGMGNAVSRTLQSIGVALGTAILGSVLNSAYRGALAGHLTGLPPGRPRRRRGQHRRRPRRRRAPGRLARASAGSRGQRRLRPGHDPRGGGRHRRAAGRRHPGPAPAAGQAGRPRARNRPPSRSRPPPAAGSARPRQSGKRGMLRTWLLHRRRRAAPCQPPVRGPSPSWWARRTCWSSGPSAPSWPPRAGRARRRTAPRARTCTTWPRPNCRRAS